MQLFLQITWNVNPEILTIGGLALRYHSIMFAMAFYFCYLILSKIYIKENISLNLLRKKTNSQYLLRVYRALLISCGVKGQAIINKLVLDSQGTL